MRKRFVVIRSVLVTAVLLLAALAPSCQPDEGATILVNATLCGASWRGRVNYTLSTPGGLSSVDGAAVPKTYEVNPDSWTCAYVSGGPSGAHLISITPSPTQNVSQGDAVSFTLNFERVQDAAIEFVTWTIDGKPVGKAGQSLEHEAIPCQIIGVVFKQRVDGCEGYRTALNETSWLQITQIEGPGGVKLWVLNEDCAVSKEYPPQQPPPVKKSQTLSADGQPVQPGTVINLPGPLMPVTTALKVETAWELTKCLNYTQSTRWLGISAYPFEPPGHECVLFELVVPGPGIYRFTLVASAEVTLLDYEDKNPANNRVESPPFTLVLNIPRKS